MFTSPLLSHLPHFQLSESVISRSIPRYVPRSQSQNASGSEHSIETNRGGPASTSRASVAATAAAARPEVYMPPPPASIGPMPRKRINANAMAFLGDSVFELYIRRKFLYPPTRLDSYHAKTVEAVRAERQAFLYDDLMQPSNAFLLQEEREVLGWAVNAQVTPPPRLKKSADGTQIYRKATAIEALVGHLYLTNQDRLNALMEVVTGGLDLGSKERGVAGTGTETKVAPHADGDSAVGQEGTSLSGETSERESESEVAELVDSDLDQAGGVNGGEQSSGLS